MTLEFSDWVIVALYFIASGELALMTLIATFGTALDITLASPRGAHPPIDPALYLRRAHRAGARPRRTAHQHHRAERRRIRADARRGSVEGGAGFEIGEASDCRSGFIPRSPGIAA